MFMLIFYLLISIVYLNYSNQYFRYLIPKNSSKKFIYI